MADTTFEEEVKEKVASYLDGESISNSLLSLLTDLAIECFKEVRNYPTNYSDDQIESDMRKRITMIAYGVVEVFGKYGAEGQLSHSENGISRSYKEDFISTFANVTPLAHIRNKDGSSGTISV